jgi:hypothetical protein
MLHLDFPSWTTDSTRSAPGSHRRTALATGPPPTMPVTAAVWGQLAVEHLVTE